MMDFVAKAKEQLDGLSKQNGLTTGKVRAISSKLFREVEDKSIENVLVLCESLLEQRTWALGVIAYDWAFRVKKQYTKETFFIFEKWLKKYVTGWGDCDDFCTHAFGELLSHNNDLFEHVKEWVVHPDFFVRRAAAVILIYPIKHNKYSKLDPFWISDMLLEDKHHLVLKGYGWMLKVLSESKPNQVYEYLENKRDTMPRVAFRYALEKFDKQRKACLMEGGLC